jgi:altronate dehydratase small subunit
MSDTPSRETRNWLWLHREDNVAMALADFTPGNTVEINDTKIVLKTPVEYGHKFAVTAIREGESVIKFAERIGIATRDIAAGEHVHVHNVKSERARKQ